MITQRSAGIIIYTIRDRKPYYLLLHHGGKYWNFPKGKIERGERDIDAAFREVYEETGIKRLNIFFHRGFRELDRYHFRVEEGRVIYKTVIFFLGRVNNMRVKISLEHKNFGWFIYSQAKKLLMYKRSQNLLLQAHIFLNKLTSI